RRGRRRAAATRSTSISNWSTARASPPRPYARRASTCGRKKTCERTPMSAPTLPYGSWPSPITAASLVEQAVSIGQVEVDGERVYWLEGRPSEGGRQVVVRWAPGAEAQDAIGSEWSARTIVHEYGGGAYAVAGDTVFFSHFPD